MSSSYKAHYRIKRQTHLSAPFELNHHGQPGLFSVGMAKSSSWLEITASGTIPFCTKSVHCCDGRGSIT